MAVYAYLRRMRRVWRWLRWPLLVLALYLGGILTYGTLTDWQPSGVDPLTPSAGQRSADNFLPDSLLTLVTWNVGYAGLGADDYFYYNRGDFFWTDLGKARTPAANVDRYVAGQRQTLASTRSDFFLLQEVDSASRRSHYRNQLAGNRAILPDYAAYYAPNFQARHVPIPVFQPWDHYGAVSSGLLTLSRFQPLRAERVQLPGEFPWPTRLFQLDRCALRQVYSTRDGRELVLYNVHLSAYDADGSVRRQQMDYLRGRVLEDYRQGRYVIAGGDWNQLPPGVNWFTFNPTVERTELLPAVAFDYLPAGWQWAYDPAGATVRDSDAPYSAHTSQRSLIDYFLLSPNLRIRDVKTIDQAFRFSDHHPVYLEVELIR